jgi:hypothetical protein
MSIRVHNLTSRKFNFDIWVAIDVNGKITNISVYKYLNAGIPIIKQPEPNVSEFIQLVDKIKQHGKRNVVTSVFIANKLPMIHSVDEWGDILDDLNDKITPMSIFGVRYPIREVKKKILSHKVQRL